MFFNEASEECGGWTGCVNKRAISNPPPTTTPLAQMKRLHYPHKGGEMTGRRHSNINIVTVFEFQDFPKINY